jgi:GNAT superfamily N-acetyltransferase
MRIEQCTPADYNQILSHLDEFWGSDRTGALHHPMFVREFGKSAFVARDDDVVAGFLFGFRSPGEPVGYVNLVAVREGYRRRGLGRLLYEQFIRFALAEGCREVKAITTPGNAHSIAFHTALGMHMLGEPADVGVLVVRDYSGPGEDRVVFRMPIGGAISTAPSSRSTSDTRLTTHCTSKGRPLGAGAEVCLFPGKGDSVPEPLASIENRLQRRKMRVLRQVPLPDGPVADLVGSRTYFSWKGLVFISQHVVLRCLESATKADAEELFDAGFRYAQEVNRLPLARGMQFGYMVIPCLVVSHAEEALIAYAESRPRKHWALFEFPVVVDLGTGAVHYYRKTPLWGGLYFSDVGELVEGAIRGALDPTGGTAGVGVAGS